MKPSSIRIVPGVIIAKFEQISVALLRKMRKLRSVSKIVSLIGEFYDIPSKESDFQSFLDENVLKISNEMKIKWMQSLSVWRKSCCDFSFFLDNPSIPKRCKNKKKAKKEKERAINFERPLYRSECDRKGRHEWNSLLVEREIAAPLHELFGFNVNLTLFDVTIFAFVRGEMLLFGLSIICDLDRRNRKVFGYSTILNNSICFLMGKVAQIESNQIVYDPLCGLGSILIENKLAMTECKNVKFIGSDINDFAIKQARINAKFCNLQTNENENDFKIDWTESEKIEFFKRDICELTENEIESERIDLIVSDLPFGHRWYEV